MSPFGMLLQMQGVMRDRLIGPASQRRLTLLCSESTARKYAISLFGQALLSAYHLALNIFLVRTLEAAEYGLFALAFVIATFGTAINNALFATPLTVYAPTCTWSTRRSFIELLLSSGHVIQLAGIFLLAFVLGLCLAMSIVAGLAFAGFVASYVARQYTRAFAFARRRPPVVVGGDLSYVVLSGVMLGCVLYLASAISLSLVLSILTVANCVAIAVELTALGIKPQLTLRWRILRRYRTIWHEVRWALLGAATTVLQAQAHSLLVTLVAGPGVYAALAAGQIPFGIVRTGTFALYSVMRPELAIAMAQQDHRTIWRTLRWSIQSLGAGIAVVVIALLLFWQPLSNILYAHKYAGYPMGWIVAGSGAITVCAALTSVPSCILQVFRDFRTLALATIYGALISLVAVAGLLLTCRAEATLIGVFSAEFFVVLYVSCVTRRRLRQQW